MIGEVRRHEVIDIEIRTVVLDCGGFVAVSVHGTAVWAQAVQPDRLHLQIDSSLSGATRTAERRRDWSTLLHSALGVHQPKGDQMADWSQRPLPDRMLGYSAGDVRNLFELYDRQRAELTRRERLAWVEEECADLTDPSRYVRDPDNAFLKLQGGRRLDAREAGVLRALAEEREALAQEQDMVPHFLIPDEVVHLLARHAPRARKDLDGDRRMQHRAVHRHADRWLAAILRGLTTPHHREPGRAPPPPELEAVAALVMLGVQDLAQRLDIAPQLLSKRDILVNALRDGPRSREALADAAQLRGWRRDVLGNTLWDLVDGRLHAVCRPGGPAGVRVAFEGLDAGSAV